MSDAHRDPTREQVLAKIHAEFRDGLEERLMRMDRALEQLARGPERSAALEDLHLAAHSLKGTAMAYEADELFEPAAALTAAARTALAAGTPPSAADRDRLAANLAVLRDAVKRYRARAEDGGSPA